MAEIKPIETIYKGYRFRSRLEARWAVFFDALGLKWEYEAEGYEKKQGEGGEDVSRYLPDFHINYPPWSQNGMFAEVKGSNKLLEEKADDYEWFLDFGSPLPGFDDSDGKQAGLIILGNIPEPIHGITLHPIIQHHQGLTWNWIYFTSFGINVLDSNDHLLGFLIEGEPIEWHVDCTQVETKYAYSAVKNAYIKARSARFEFGECG